jgi:membrane-bound serine protease (ClpP class)
MVGLANYTELLIIVLGVLLLGVEIFVLPGFGIGGIAGISCIVIGLILSFQDFVIPSPSMPWQMKELTTNIGKVIGSFIAAFAIAVVFIRYVLKSISKVIHGPYLNETLEGSHADSAAIVDVKEGDTGEVITSLRPSGRVRVKERVFDVVTEGDFVEKGSTVTVVKISRNKIIVSRKK